MPDSDIINRNTQFLLGIEDAVRTKSIFKIIPCSIIGFYAENYFGLEKPLSLLTKDYKARKEVVWVGS